MALWARLDADQDDWEPVMLNRLMGIYLNSDLITPDDYYSIACLWINRVKYILI